jgi:hypothetical protein
MSGNSEPKDEIWTPADFTLESVDTVLAGWAAMRPGEKILSVSSDPRVKAFAEAARKLLHSDPRLQQMLGAMIDSHDDPTRFEIRGMGDAPIHTPNQGANHFLRSVQHVGMIIEEMPEYITHLHTGGHLSNLPNQDFKFPKDYLQPAAWESLMGFILDNEDIRWLFGYNLNHRRMLLIATKATTFLLPSWPISYLAASLSAGWISVPASV